MHVGLDLGTTNSALAYINPVEAEDADFPPIHTLPVPQVVAPDRMESRPTLPSFLHVGEGEYLIGAYAREQGAVVPTRSVHSAKSWLANPDVDRTEKILPWDAGEGGRVLSPVEASARYLSFLADAWRQQNGTALGEQNLTLTVPASFDEEARNLTVQAAREAGLEQLTLLEEPAAAFYAWIAAHLSQSQRSLQDGMLVLVCDVGGGTSDFTLIRVNRQGDHVEFTRTDVGKHLLLGGDNLDLTLAWLVEAKLGKQLSIRQRSALRRQCASAKERLLSNPALPSVEVTVLGAGSGLVGGTLKTEITRAEALELALDGFLPFCELDAEPQEDKRSIFRELGLPYVADPAVTRHLAAFLRQSGGVQPDAVLFNGGFFIPEICRQRVADVLERWYGKRPMLLENQQLDLAVAVGAAYYSYVRATGSGLLVRGGLPRAYYLGLGNPTPEALSTVCLVPRGTEDGATLSLDREDLELLANKPVQFTLYSSLSRTEDALGQVVTFAPDEAAALHRHAPLQALIRFGKRTEERLVPVTVGARLTEVGTLDIYADSRISEHRWKLEFALRKSAAASGVSAERPQAAIREGSLPEAELLLAQVFDPQAKPALGPEELVSRLEQTLGLGRNSWPLPVLRALAERLLALAEGRRRSAAHEARWLNLCGFCLRPGFGFPGDELHVEQARRVYASGLVFANQAQNEIEWWVFLGRIAGGFNRNQQGDAFQRASHLLLPRGPKPKRTNTSLLREMWRAIAGLERLPIQNKTELGEALSRRVKAGESTSSDYWCMGRIGARELLYGPTNLVVPPSTVTRWIDPLLPVAAAGEAIATMARKTGDTARDVPAATRHLVHRAVETHADSARLLALLEGGDPRDLQALGRVFGEELPSGLVFTRSAV